MPTETKVPESFCRALRLLGLKVRDRVIWFSGVATSASYDLYGCTQIVVTPGLDKDGKPGEGHWYDLERLTLVDKKPVMFLPVAATEKGPERKPLPRRV